MMIRDHDDNVKSHPQRLVLRSKRLSKIPTTSQPSHIQRPAKYKQWKEGGDLKLEKAVSEVLSNQLSIRKAAEQYGIPHPHFMTMCLAEFNLEQVVAPSSICHKQKKMS